MTVRPPSALLGLCAALLLGGCERIPLSYARDAEIAAGCEDPTEALLEESSGMLPGRRCMPCHGAFGMASAEAFTAAGTVYSSDPQACNGGGQNGVTVEILSASGVLLTRTHSTRGGNFHTSAALTFPIRARITYGDTVKEMQSPVDSGDCASCHDGLTQARINLGN